MQPQVIKDTDFLTSLAPQDNLSVSPTDLNHCLSFTKPFTNPSVKLPGFVTTMHVNLSLRPQANSGLSHIGVTSNGRLIVTDSAQNMVFILHEDTGMILDCIGGGIGGINIYCPREAYGLKDDRLLIISKSPPLAIVDIKTKAIQQVKLKLATPSIPISQVYQHPTTGEILFIQENEIHILNLETGVTAPFPIPPLDRSMPPKAIAVSADGSALYVATSLELVSIPLVVERNPSCEKEETRELGNSVELDQSVPSSNSGHVICDPKVTKSRLIDIFSTDLSNAGSSALLVAHPRGDFFYTSSIRTLIQRRTDGSIFHHFSGRKMHMDGPSMYGRLSQPKSLVLSHDGCKLFVLDGQPPCGAIRVFHLSFIREPISIDASIASIPDFDSLTSLVLENDHLQIKIDCELTDLLSPLFSLYPNQVRQVLKNLKVSRAVFFHLLSHFDLKSTKLESNTASPQIPAWFSTYCATYRNVIEKRNLSAPSPIESSNINSTAVSNSSSAIENAKILISSDDVPELPPPVYSEPFMLKNITELTSTTSSPSTESAASSPNDAELPAVSMDLPFGAFCTNSSYSNIFHWTLSDFCDYMHCSTSVSNFDPGTIVESRKFIESYLAHLESALIERALVTQTPFKSNWISAPYFAHILCLGLIYVQEHCKGNFALAQLFASNLSRFYNRLARQIIFVLNSALNKDGQASPAFLEIMTKLLETKVPRTDTEDTKRFTTPIPQSPQSTIARNTPQRSWRSWIQSLSPPSWAGPSLKKFDPTGAGETPDYTIVCSDGERLDVHSKVLSHRWPFFKNAISFGGLESIEKSVHLPENTWGATTTVAFLQFLYHGDLITTDESILFDILKSAFWFGLVDTERLAQPGFARLINHCSAPLSKLNVDNCFHLLQLSLNLPYEEYRESVELTCLFASGHKPVHTLSAQSKYWLCRRLFALSIDSTAVLPLARPTFEGVGK